MLNNRFQKTLFHWTSLLTTWFPRGGARFFDALIPPILGNRLLVEAAHRKNLAVLRQVRKFERILVVPDIHIGDAIMMQSAIMAFRDFFPQARIDFVVKKSVGCLMEGNPDVSNLYPLFTGSLFPSEADLQSLRKLAEENQYDLYYNCSPFFSDRQIAPKGKPVLNFLTSAAGIMRNDLDQTGNNHTLFQCYDLPHKLLALGRQPARSGPLKGVPLMLSDEAFAEAEAFLQGKQKGPLLFMNPDTASRFTRVPFQKQVELLKLLARLPGKTLLGTAFVEKGIEEKLLGRLEPVERDKMIFVPPSLSLEGYAALIDFADVFISGDTGPLHMAAARKLSKSGKVKFRNRTFVVSIFGATPARVSGYDSTNPLFQPANQDAPSRTYISESPCRNVTCVNKMAKTCGTVRCFEVLDVERIVRDIQTRFEALKSIHPA